MAPAQAQSAPSGAEQTGTSAAEVQAAADFVTTLLKGIKNIRLYRHAQDRYLEYLGPAHRALTEFVEAYDSMPLRLRPYSLDYRDNVIYEEPDKENLTYKFYRDGLRFIILRRGIPAEELLRFVMLSIDSVSDASLFQEDMVTRFWKESFDFIEHIVVEGFGFDDVDAEEVDADVDKIIGYLRKHLAAKGDDVTRFARLSEEDLALELADVDQVRGGVISGRPAEDGDLDQVQEQLLVEERQLVFAKMVLILFQILEQEANPGDYDMMLESLTQVLDTLLVSEDVAGAVALMQRFEAIRAQPLPEERRQLIERFHEALLAVLVEPHRLDSVGQYLALSPRLDEAAVRAYLSYCGEPELVHLVELLVSAERQDARAILVDLLADKGADHIDLFVHRLDHNSSRVVRDMLAIIRRLRPHDRAELVSRCLDHPNVMIRLEGLKDLAKSQEAVAGEYIERAMQDPDIQMRMGAYRAMASRTPQEASTALIRQVRAEAFGGKERRERTAIFSAIGRSQTAEALAFLQEPFSKRSSLFDFGRAKDLKLLAVQGLAAMHTVEAFRVLAEQVQNKNNAPEVQTAAHRAASQLKRELVAARDREEAQRER